MTWSWTRTQNAANFWKLNMAVDTSYDTTYCNEMMTYTQNAANFQQVNTAVHTSCYDATYCNEMMTDENERMTMGSRQ